MHRDPLLSTGKKPFFHFGHTGWFSRWLSTSTARCSRCPFCYVSIGLRNSTRSWGDRTERKQSSQTSCYSWFLTLFRNGGFALLATMPGRTACPTPAAGNFDFIGRGRMDAALYAPPAKHRGRGRPRVKGRRLARPGNRGHKPWKRLRVNISGRPATVHVQVFDALWYKVARGRLLRFVLVRGWPGHSKDDVLVTTDLRRSAKDIVTCYCNRWSIDETFGWVKSRLGFEDPQNRTELAAERTAPDGSVVLLAVHPLVWPLGDTTEAPAVS